jgi:hypothetical protein
VNIASKCELIAAFFAESWLKNAEVASKTGSEDGGKGWKPGLPPL